MITAIGMLVAATFASACAGGQPAGQEQTRVVSALRLTLARQPVATDRQLHLLVSMSSLSDSARPVDRVDVERVGGEVRLRAWVRERVPRSNEPVENTAVVREHLLELVQPVGDAVVVDASAQPPRPVPVAAS